MPRIVSVGVALCAGVAATAAAAQQSAPPYGPSHALTLNSNLLTPSYFPTFGAQSAEQIAFRQFRGRMKDLRDEGLKLQAADGGVLTPEHRSMIQRKLDTIQAAYAPYTRSVAAADR